MLRVFVLVVAMVAFTAALIVVAVMPAGWPLLIWVGVPLAGILFERARYGAAQLEPVSGRWQETPERFVDDVSGREMVVWYDAGSGVRRYVATGRIVNDAANELQ